MPTPLIIDLSHWNDVSSFEKIKDAGIVGIIHKATEGTSYDDDMYKQRRDAAKKVGLTWSSYHYMKHGNQSAQMENYLKFVQPVQGERLCLDYEDGACTLDDLEDAVKYLMDKGQNYQITVYSGHLIKQHCTKYNALLAQTSLWLAQYTTGVPSWPTHTWPTWTLWQYTDQGKITGVNGSVDLDAFNGSRDNCIKWMTPVGDEPQPIPEPEPGPEELPPVTVKVKRGTEVIIEEYE